jgi:hypothetical protein
MAITEGTKAVMDFMGKTGDAKKTDGGSRKEVPEEIKREAAALDSAISELENAPKFSYEKQLNELGVSKEEAALMVDTLLRGETLTKSYPITSGVSVVFKARSVNDDMRLAQHLEDTKPMFQSTIDLSIARYNVAASLVRYGNKDFSETFFQEKLEWVNNLPKATINVLVSRLNKFDRLVFAITEDGALENF